MVEKLGLSISGLREPLFEHLCDAGMQLLAAGFEQGAISDVLNQHVLEAVGRLWRRAVAEDHLVRQGVGARYALDQRRPLTAAEPVKASTLTCDCFGQGGLNSGRNVRIASTGRFRIRSIKQAAPSGH